MKTTGRANEFDRIEDFEEPFIKDLSNDLTTINKVFIASKAKEVKLKLIDLILKDI